jgi:hemerythrin-like domain-containing protein
MEYSTPIQMLVDEHRVITSVLDVVETVTEQLGETGEFPQSFFEQAFDFFPNFADKCHHAKEEDRLFPLLEARGVPREGGPIQCMLNEHEEGRRHVRAVREALTLTAEGDLGARRTVQHEARAYVDLLRLHIRKENEILFLIADQRLTADDQQTLLKQFQCAEHSKLPPGSHEKYVALAEELVAFAGVALADRRVGVE